LGNKGRWEYLRAIYGRYQKASRKAKKVILDEFCENTGYHRKYAIRLLSGPPLWSDHTGFGCQSHFTRKRPAFEDRPIIRGLSCNIT